MVKLNFAPGIKAKDINYNFDVTHDWIKRERRRVGGPGIVDGFDLSADLATFTVKVSSGTIIKKEKRFSSKENLSRPNLPNIYREKKN